MKDYEMSEDEKKNVHARENSTVISKRDQGK
jgi:hypothetical protein